MVAGAFRWLTGAGTYRMFAVLQGFYALAIVATYWGARRLTSRNMSLLAAVMVAAVPAVDSASRSFLFSLPAAALLAATLATQLHADAFRSRWLSLLWGLALGLSALSRTVVLAMLPAVLLAAFVNLLVNRPRRAQFVNVALGLGVSLIVAGSWYSATWRPVLRYLTTYGYGAEAGSYGVAHPLLSPAFWGAPLTLVTDELYAPLTVALIACFAAGLVSWLIERGRRRGAAVADAADAAAAGGPVLRFLRGPKAMLWIFCVGVYVVLMSTSNSGSLFELPLLPPICMLAVAVLGEVGAGARTPIAAACLCAAGLSFVTSAGLVGGASDVVASVGPVHPTVIDGQSDVEAYAIGTGVVCAGADPCAGAHVRDVSAYLRRWVEPSQSAAAFLHAYALAQGCQPVVFFAVQDPFFNTNTVDLAYQLAYASGLPTGVLESPQLAGASLLSQLQDPERGQPNLVITGPLPRYNLTPAAQTARPGVAGHPAAHPSPVYQPFSPLTDQRAGTRALQEDGFEPVGRLRLPDGRSMTFWWRHRGDCASAP
jgi:hypothetical protein